MGGVDCKWGRRDQKWPIWSHNFWSRFFAKSVRPDGFRERFFWHSFSQIFTSNPCGQPCGQLVSGGPKKVRQKSVVFNLFSKNKHIEQHFAKIFD